jgi:two-component system, LytTR family, response regulator
MHRAIIIDDEQTGVNTLKLLLEKHCPRVKVVAATTDPEKGITLVEDYQPDILFLDISMPQMSGFEVLEQMKERKFRLVFTTAHAQYALKAIKNHAEDYLLKPIDVDELKACVERIISVDAAREPAARTDRENIVELPVRDGIIFIRPKDIIRLEADGSYTAFYMENRIKYLASRNLKECEHMLAAPFLFRCHQSHLINLHKVVKMVSADGLFAQMSDGSLPEVGRKNKDLLIERLKSL